MVSDWSAKDSKAACKSFKEAIDLRAKYTFKKQVEDWNKDTQARVYTLSNYHLLKDKGVFKVVRDNKEKEALKSPPSLEQFYKG